MARSKIAGASVPMGCAVREIMAITVAIDVKGFVVITSSRGEGVLVHVAIGGSILDAFNT